MARILSVEHGRDGFEYNSAAFFAERGDRRDSALFFEGQGAPDPRLYDLVVVYGGEMSAYDDRGHPWILQEMRFLEACLEAETRILGICFGSQILARVLGAEVFKCEVPEFGFKRVSLTAAGAKDPVLGCLGGEDGTFVAIQWHDDAWELPSGAELLASGERWANQAFRYGPRVLGTQFHLEFTREHMAWSVGQPGFAPPPDPEGEDPQSFASPSPRYGEVRESMERVLTGILAEVPGSGDRTRDRGLQGAVARSRSAK